MPRRFGLPLSSLAGRLAADLNPTQRRIVESNLRRVLGPNVDPDRVRAVARRVFQNSARNYFDFFRLPHLGLDELAGLIRVHHESRFWDALRQGDGVVLTSAHLGTFDAAAQILAARHVEVLVLVEPLDPPELLDLVAGIRRSHGLRIEAVGSHSLRQALQFLRDGKVVVVFSDRAIQGHGETVDFFGEPARLPTGALELALRTGAALLPAFAVRLPTDRFAVFVEPVLPLVRTGHRHHDVRVNLATLRDVLERYIRAYPDQWLVFQPIWPLAQGERRSGGSPTASDILREPEEPAPRSPRTARRDRGETLARLTPAEVTGGYC